MKHPRKTRVLFAGLALGLAATGSTIAVTSPALATDSTSAPSTSSIAPTSGSFLAPYYADGDLTGDGLVDADDLDLLTEALGITSADDGWAAVAPADFDADATITVTDLADLSQRVLYDDGTFELVEASAVEMQKAMNAGVITSVALTERYLARIAAYDATVVDTSPSGRALNSIIATSDAALAAAAASDAARAANGGPRSMMDGIPVLLKDNYDTLDLPTTAGCSCWAENQTETDAHMVAGLRADGAVILGKASLDEFAYGFASEFSTGSEPGASKLVASPYHTSKTAGGSSGGTGSSIAANLGAIGFGTDTGGSIRVPSGYNQLVGLRPTIGLTSRDGIVPLALSQDTGGPMARTVTDVAIALDAVVGSDSADPVTAGADDRLPASYTASLDTDALAGVRLGYLTSMAETRDAAANRLFIEAVADLEAQGAEVVPIAIDGIGPILNEGSGSTNEFKHDLNDYIDTHLADDVEVRTLDQILASNLFVNSRRNTYVSRNNVTEQTYQEWMTAHTGVIAQGETLVTGALDEHDLAAALIYPTNTSYGTHSTNLRLSPNTGMPAVTVPMGRSTTADGVATVDAGINLEFLGRDFDEPTLLGLAYDYEQATEHRTAPQLYGALSGDVVTGPGSSTAAPGSGRVTLAAPKQVKAGETLTVKVATDAADLYAYDLGLDYDSSRLRLTSATSATTGHTTVTDDDGELRLVHTKLGTSPAADGATGLATVTFTALKTGAAKVSVASLRTVTSDLTATARTNLASAAIAVAATPVPKRTTTTKVTLKPAKVKAGKRVTAVVRVSATGAVPTGTVRLQAPGGVTKTARLTRGKATFTFVAKGAGVRKAVKRTVRVSYRPSGEFRASTRGVKLTVTRR